MVDKITLTIDGEQILCAFVRDISLRDRLDDAFTMSTEVCRNLLDEAGVHIQDEQDEDEIEKFKEFLDRIDPTDFEAGS